MVGLEARKHSDAFQCLAALKAPPAPQLTGPFTWILVWPHERHRQTGWIVCVKTPDHQERFFVVAEPIQLKALELTRQKIPAREGDDVTLGLSVSAEELAERGMKPGDVQPSE